jgi:dihydrofolate reductase
MRRVIVSEFITLDGVMEAPGHEEHQDGRNAWALLGASEDQQRFKADELFAAGAILLGRVTYQIFATFWPSAPGDQEFASRMNSIEKYVVSTTLKEAEWNNTVILRGDIAEEVSKLKQQHGGDIVIYGSAGLVNALMKHDLIDEYRLMVFPVVLGSGKRLFRDESDTSHLRLVGSRAFSSGIVLLSYQPAGESPSSEYAETLAWTEEQIKSLQAAQTGSCAGIDPVHRHRGFNGTRRCYRRPTLAPAPGSSR